MLNNIASLYRRKIRPFSKLIQAICIPIFALAIPLSIGNKQSYCGYVMIIMSSFWLLETIPMAATSLLPILLFPLFGIMTSRDVTSVYIQDILMLFLAVIVLTQSIRSSGLNERLSLKIILLFGSNPKFLLLGIMCITWFLSIWISNNASVCMMMFPITVEIAKYLIQVNEAVTAEIKKCHQLVSFGAENSVERVDFAEGQEPSRESLFEENSEAEPSNEYSKESLKILKAFCLSVSFSSTIGGSGSLIASPPNILLKGFLDEKFPNNNINFLSFFLYSLPFTFTMLISAWIVLCLLYIPRRVSRKSIHSEKIIEQEPLNRAIKRKYNEYGSLNWEQKSVGTFFIVLILLWLTRDIYWIKGWSYFFPKGIT
ncbi:solute carrier family 13 member 2 [Brachionus plicatilis]|uniref:Solute carrier family 13 member 2 n=1 Tax=Brachionus plicatilis TaxID=10195 RepID=A0A3M7Q0C0_BRAPC|nr:solute carrier family 13 member 2 [Brachionus plicatilis]